MRSYFPKQVMNNNYILSFHIFPRDAKPLNWSWKKLAFK